MLYATREKVLPREMTASRPKLLVVDDELQVIKSLKRLLRGQDYEILWATGGAEALEIVRSHDIGVVISDQMMPGMDGVTFLEKLGRISPDTVKLMLTGYASFQNALDAINRCHVFEYLQKPWTAESLQQALERAFRHWHLVVENKRLTALTLKQNAELKGLNARLEQRVRDRTRQLEEAVREGVLMLAQAAEAKDDDTGDHVLRMKNLTTAIALEMGLNPQYAEKIGFFSMMHDVGKIHVPDRILKKKSPLTAAEWKIMQRHTVAGEKILGSSSFYDMARRIARSHHERMDGSGYPDGLEGDRIPLEARIVAVADVYDALGHARPYKPAWPRDKVLAEMRHLSGWHLDSEIVSALLEVVRTGDGPEGS